MTRTSPALKCGGFTTRCPQCTTGFVRLPTKMPGLETLLAEFAAFPDGRHDDQVDAVCNVAANRELVIRRARHLGERLGRIRAIPRVVPSTPPKSRDQELYERRNRADKRTMNAWISQMMGPDGERGRSPAR